MHQSQGKLLTRDTLLILAASFFYFSSPMLVTPLVTGFTETLGGSAALMGLVGGMMNLCSLFCRPVVGSFIDRVSKYKLSMAGALCMAAACLGYLFAPNAGVVIAARMVNGVGFACCSLGMSTWMTAMLPENRIGSGMGIYGMMNALAMALAPSIGVVVYQRFGYRAAFGVAMGCILMTLLIIQFVRGKTAGTQSGRPQENGKIQLVDIHLLPVALIIMLFAIPYCATQSFIVRYAETRGLPVTISLFFPIYAAALLIMRLAMKNLFDRLPFSFFFTLSAVCSAAALLLMTFMGNNLVMALAAVFLAAGYGLMCSVCQSTAIILAGPGKRGLGNSTYYIGLDLGMTLGPLIGGWLYGGADLIWFYPVLLLCIPAAAAVFLLSYRRTFKK